MTSLRDFFSSATIRLTSWYLLILTILSLLFSGIVYSIAANELHRPVDQGNQGQFGYSYSVLGDLEDLRQQREREGKTRLVTSLVVFNAVVIATGGLASYYLAKRTLQPIEEALEAQTRFSSDAAHELRTPLAVMQSEIEIGLRGKKTDPHLQREILESTLDEVGRLRSLTDRLLVLSNLKTVEVAVTSLDDVATEAINRVIPLAQAKKISIDATVGKQKAIANADVLTDVIVILLDNAIKYSPAKSTITVSAKEQGKYVAFQVADIGHGIDPADLPHIFDRFYRADTSRSKTNVEGHGLGLSIAKRSIEAMNGSISAVSEVDKGTTFTIRLNS